MHTHLKALHSIVLRKMELVLSNENLNIFTCIIGNSAKKPKNWITEYFDSNTENSRSAVLSRLVCCDVISCNKQIYWHKIRTKFGSIFGNTKTSLCYFRIREKIWRKIKLKITRELDSFKHVENRKFSIRAEIEDI